MAKPKKAKTYTRPPSETRMYCCSYDPSKTLIYRDNLQDLTYMRAEAPPQIGKNKHYKIDHFVSPNIELDNPVSWRRLSQLCYIYFKSSTENHHREGIKNNRFNAMNSLESSGYIAEHFKYMVNRSTNGENTVFASESQLRDTVEFFTDPNRLPELSRFYFIRDPKTLKTVKNHRVLPQFRERYKVKEKQYRKLRERPLKAVFNIIEICRREGREVEIIVDARVTDSMPSARFNDGRIQTYKEFLAERGYIDAWAIGCCGKSYATSMEEYEAILAQQKIEVEEQIAREKKNAKEAEEKAMAAAMAPAMTKAQTIVSDPVDLAEPTEMFKAPVSDFIDPEINALIINFRDLMLLRYSQLRQEIVERDVKIESMTATIGDLQVQVKELEQKVPKPVETEEERMAREVREAQLREREELKARLAKLEQEIES